MEISCIFSFDPENSDFVSIMRLHRNRLLQESDWTMHSDAPTDKTAWADYRQQLRNFPAKWNPSATANFPKPPT